MGAAEKLIAKAVYEGYLNDTMISYTPIRTAFMNAAGNPSLTAAAVADAWSEVGVGSAYLRPVISVPSTLCFGSSSNITVTHPLTNAYWTSSPNISINVSGNSVSATVAASVSGPGWIRYMLNGEVWAEENVYVYGNIVEGTLQVDNGSPEALYTVNFISGTDVMATANYPNATNYNWSLIYSDVTLPWGGAANPLFFYMNSATSATFRVTVTRSSPCGGTLTADFNFVKTFKSAAYTVSKVGSAALRLAIDQTKEAAQRIQSIKTSGTKCEVQLMTAPEGKLVLEQNVANFNNFTLDVSKISNGVYLLRLMQNGATVHLQAIDVRH